MRLILAFLLSASVGHLATPQGRNVQADATLKVAVQGKGTIVIKLFAKEAPKACTHITQLARQGFYDGQRFFRVTRTPRPYIAQVGDPASKNGVDNREVWAGGTGVRIPYEESGHSNEKYAVGLAALLSKDRD